MNIFYTDKDPIKAAQSLPDKHIVKMPVETVQMLVSACLANGHDPQVLTSKGTIHKGGYHKHPCTVWAGISSKNAGWLYEHGIALCNEYRDRYGKIHFAEGQLLQLAKALCKIRYGEFTTPALAMPDECKVENNPVESYRNCIRLKVHTKPDSFVWNKGRNAPEWL